MKIASPITISELVIMLLKIQEKHGDLRLFIEYDGEYVAAIATVITAHREEEGDYWKRKYESWLKYHNLKDGEKYLLIET